MNKEYLDRNAKGYEGDTFVHEDIRSLIEIFGITQIIETGTYMGATTKRLASFSVPVISLEFDIENYKKAIRRVTESNVRILNGDSGSILKTLKADNHTLYFLDAHWGDAWPLLDELKQIAELKIKPVIIIHDFKVPGTDFGFDSYKGIELDLKYIEAGLREIYDADGYSYHYNNQADGAARGLIYIYPKVTDTLL